MDWFLLKNELSLDEIFIYICAANLTNYSQCSNK